MTFLPFPRAQWDENPLSSIALTPVVLTFDGTHWYVDDASAAVPNGFIAQDLTSGRLFILTNDEAGAAGYLPMSIARGPSGPLAFKDQ
jgi:hypothetical protein